VKASDNFSQSEELTEHVSAPGSEAARHWKAARPPIQRALSIKIENEIIGNPQKRDIAHVTNTIPTWERIESVIWRERVCKGNRKQEGHSLQASFRRRPTFKAERIGGAVSVLWLWLKRHSGPVHPSRARHGP